MRMKVDIIERSVSELQSELGFPARKFKAFQVNPYLKQGSNIGKIVGLCDGIEVGGTYVFPLLLKTPRGKFTVLAGSTLHVDPKYRRSGLGMKLPEEHWQKSPSGIAVGAGLSQMALPVHQFLDYNVFLLPRYMMLWKSRAVLEKKLRGILCKLMVKSLDACIGLYSACLCVLTGMKLRGLSSFEVRIGDEEFLSRISALIAADRHPYGEVHDAAWLKWHLSESFADTGPAKLRVLLRGGDLVGFYMTKCRFYETASHRGFKNVWLGSVIEWGVVHDQQVLLPWILLHAALTLRKQGCDAVEIPTDDACVISVLRKLGWRSVGEGNFVIKAGSTSPLAEDADMKIQSNWRLRPAMGDNGLS